MSILSSVLVGISWIQSQKPSKGVVPSVILLFPGKETWAQKGSHFPQVTLLGSVSWASHPSTQTHIPAALPLTSPPVHTHPWSWGPLAEQNQLFLCPGNRFPVTKPRGDLQEFTWCC